ncbi:MAG: T9SS type A sorting domain-containing protein [Bacteroidales bacterium]|nr:T9SS type A sorting domain-containing protein [Bacteroidales bacterium]
MQKYLLFVGLLLAQFGLKASDTLTVMQYNLLYYGEITSFCNNNNNSLSMKDPHLRTVLDFVKPDIFTVNEMSANEAIHQHLLDNNLNINFVDYYKRAASSNTAGSNIVNQLFYDSRKLQLKKQYTAQNYVRDVDVYELYYKSNDLAYGDTAFIVCVVAHLKAGSSSGDANSRKIMAENTLRFLETRFANSNVLMMGDFNLYNGQESAFQTLLNYPNPAVRFLDPIGQIGNWSNNSFYAGIHTQSTNTQSNCKSGGGLDDRFDFILISDEVRFGTAQVRYVQESYKAVGQDGHRFNGTVNQAPQNTSVPQNVADALYHFSDHLPVTLKLSVDKVLDIHENQIHPLLASVQPNPVKSTALVDFYMPSTGKLHYRLMDLSGRLLLQEEVSFDGGHQSLNLDFSSYPSGLYILNLSDGINRFENLKIVRQ